MLIGLLIANACLVQMEMLLVVVAYMCNRPVSFCLLSKMYITPVARIVFITFTFTLQLQ